MSSVFLLVFDQLTIQLVSKSIDGGIHVIRIRMSEQVTTRYVYSGLSFLHHFLDSENDMGLRGLVEMTLQALEFVLHVLPQRGGYFEMMTSDCQLHIVLLRFMGLTLATLLSAAR
tara:strand:+ start:2624 stop:2968 length:345 start_codon:yes stop_codon:yes gene_type:complete